MYIIYRIIDKGSPCRTLKSNGIGSVIKFNRSLVFAFLWKSKIQLMNFGGKFIADITFPRYWRFSLSYDLKKLVDPLWWVTFYSLVAPPHHHTTTPPHHTTPGKVWSELTRLYTGLYSVVLDFGGQPLVPLVLFKFFHKNVMSVADYWNVYHHLHLLGWSLCYRQRLILFSTSHFRSEVDYSKPLVSTLHRNLAHTLTPRAFCYLSKIYKV